MNPLSRLEAIIADVMERPAWLLSSRRLHPLELTAALTRALEERAIRLADRVLAPDDYTISLNPADLAAFADAQPVLEAELADYLARTIVERDLSSNRRSVVRFESSPSVRQGHPQVTARFSSQPASSSAMSPRGAKPPRSTAARSPAARAPASPPRIPTRGPTLVLLDAAGEPSATYPLDGGPVTIGRRAGATIVLSDSKASRDHARVERTHDGYAVTDLGSLNGTTLRGTRLSGTRPLHDGDEITIGHTRFRFIAE